MHTWLMHIYPKLEEEKKTKELIPTWYLQPKLPICSILRNKRWGTLINFWKFLKLKKKRNYRNAFIDLKKY